MIDLRCRVRRSGGPQQRTSLCHSGAYLSQAICGWYDIPSFSLFRIVLPHSAAPSCVVFDCGSRSANGGVPRALWYGLELVRYSLNRLWLDRNSSSNRSSRSGGGVGDATGDLQGGEEVEGRGLEQAMASGNSCGSTAVAAARTSGQQTQSSQSGEATTTQAAADLRRSQSRASAWNTPHLRGVAVTADFEKVTMRNHLQPWLLVHLQDGFHAMY